MKRRYLIAAFILISLFFVVGVNVVHAQWPAISTGYAVTTNWHGIDVPLGESVTAWAGTTNSEVYKVEFEWKNATEHVIFEVNVTEFVPYTTPNYPPDAPQGIIDWATDPKHAGVTIRYANNTQVPDSVGDWGVQVLFYAPGGHLKGEGSDIIKIRATSFNAIPEVPVAGTAGTISAMLLGLGLYRHKKKKR